MTKQFDFSEALRLMKLGKKVRRVSWRGLGLYLIMEDHTIYFKKDSYMGMAFSLCIEYGSIECFKEFQYKEITKDLLADDWEVVE